LKIKVLISLTKALLSDVFRNIWAYILRACVGFTDNLDDFLIFGGLFGIWYGFSLKYPWLGHVVTGALAMLMGLFITLVSRKRGKP